MALCPARLHRGLAHFVNLFLGRYLLGKPNFSFQKRQKELAKKKKSDEKRQRKLDHNAVKPAEDQQQRTESGDNNKNSI